MPDIRERARSLFGRIQQGVQQGLDFILGRKRERAVPVERVPNVLTKYQAQFNERTAALAKRLEAGEISPQVWRGLMLTELRYLHIVAAAATAGGFGNLTPQAIFVVDRRVREEAAYLDRWVAQLEREGKIDSEKVRKRAELYGEAAGLTASEVEDRVQYQSFPNLPFQPKDRTICRRRCHCRWDWKIIDSEKGDADVTWVLGDAEHCETCLKRAEACKPLKIRSFIITNMPPNMSELMVE